jgi:uncharacterized membrane protein
MTATYITKRVLVAATVVAAMALIHMVPAEAKAWNFTVPAQQITPVNGAFVLNAGAFEDGKARHFEYIHSPNQRIRFFVVKSVDGVIRAAFDACDVCWKSKKGYRQEGQNMICINCGLKFRTDKINEVHGGCNPAGLRRTLEGDKVIVSQQDLLQGLRFFQ